jgi:hypothetical protein
LCEKDIASQLLAVVFSGHSSDLRITCNDQYILTHDLSPEQVSPEQASDFSFFAWDFFGICFLKGHIIPRKKIMNSQTNNL